MDWSNYECDNQMTISDYLDRLDIIQKCEQKYQIPRDYQKEEGWTDDWHYTEVELPPEPNIYYCIHKLWNSENWNYTYMAWAYENWWAYAGYGTKWLLVRGERREYMRPFAWVRVPDLYYRTDDHCEFLRENFVTKEDWEHEQILEEIRDGSHEKK